MKNYVFFFTVGLFIMIISCGCLGNSNSNTSITSSDQNSLPKQTQTIVENSEGIPLSVTLTPKISPYFIKSKTPSIIRQGDKFTIHGMTNLNTDEELFVIILPGKELISKDETLLSKVAYGEVRTVKCDNGVCFNFPVDSEDFVPGKYDYDIYSINYKFNSSDSFIINGNTDGTTHSNSIPELKGVTPAASFIFSKLNNDNLLILSSERNISIEDLIAIQKNMGYSNLLINCLTHYVNKTNTRLSTQDEIRRTNLVSALDSTKESQKQLQIFVDLCENGKRNDAEKVRNNVTSLIYDMNQKWIKML